jgi:hypothetical protein
MIEGPSGDSTGENKLIEFNILEKLQPLPRTKLPDANSVCVAS